MSVPSPDTVRQEAKQDADAPRTNVLGETKKRQPKKFKEREFKKGVGTELDINKKGEVTPKKDEEKEIEISVETQEMYETFLRDHLGAVALALKNNPSLRTNSFARQDVALVDVLTTNGVVDETKMANFFNKASGWIVTTEMIQNYLANVQPAIGLISQMKPGGERAYATSEMIMRLGGRGAMHALWYDTLRPNLGKINAILWGGVAAPLAGAIAVAGASPGTPLAGAAVGAGVVVGAEAAALGLTGAVSSLRNAGTELRLSPNTQIFTAIKGDADQKAYVRALTGVDFDHLQVNPTTGKIEKINTLGVTVESDVNPDDLRDTAAKYLQARRAFFKDIRVSTKRLDATPEEALLKSSVAREGVQFEQLGTQWGQDIIDEFQANNGGILDKWDQKPGNPNFCISNGPIAPMILTPPVFSEANLDIPGNVRRFQKARQNFILREVTAMLGKELAGESTAKIRTAVQAKIEAVNNNTDKAKRREPIEKRKAALAEERNKLTPQQAKIDAYKQKAAEPNAADQQFRREFRVHVTVGRNIDQAIACVDTEIGKLESTLGARINKRDVKINTQAALVIKKLTPVDTTGMSTTDKQAALSRRQDQEREIRQEIRKSYDESTHAQQEKLKAHNQEVTKLLDLQKQDQVYREGIRKSEDEVLASAREDLSAMETAFNKLTDPPAAPPTVGGGMNIPQTSLLTNTVDEIMPAINAAYAADATAGIAPAACRGWPASRNNLTANRELVIRAASEAKTQKQEAEDPNRPARRPDYLEITGWTITEDQLRRLPEDQLLGLVNNRHTTIGTEGWPATDNTNPDYIKKLRNAITESRNKFLVRHAIATTERINDLDARTKKEDDAIKKIDEESTEKRLQQLQLTNKLLDRQGEIFSKTASIKTETDKYTDTTKVTNAETAYSRAERSAGQEKGYYETLNLLFDYQHGSTEPSLSREEYFKQLYAFLPPNKLASLMNKSFNLGLGMTHTPSITMENVLLELQGQLTLTNNVSYPELYEGFKDVIMTLGKEAVA